MLHICYRTINFVSEDKTREREEMMRQSINESEKKAGWSHVTALHCIVLPEHVPPGYCSPLLTHLALKWQDRSGIMRNISHLFAARYYLPLYRDRLNVSELACMFEYWCRNRLLSFET